MIVAANGPQKSPQYFGGLVSKNKISDRSTMLEEGAGGGEEKRVTERRISISHDLPISDSVQFGSCQRLSSSVGWERQRSTAKRTLVQS
ncbi:hypothetical protein EVAR_69235_1 [Eumeta japonica]|uniref:Uncharacterized protein n=1 Tax=Eumeta variegata TaxID=151549 RepID=A0A4C2A7F7_EUMVA|nr:hypothetical protein EVAR_69235_1 [Eumeta japonica]